MTLLHASVLLPFLGALTVAWLYRRYALRSIGWIVFAIAGILFAFFLSKLPSVIEGVPLSAAMPWIPSLGIEFTVVLDGLGIMFALLITGIGSLVVLYANYYLSKKENLGSFYTYLLIFMGAMLGIVLSDNMLVLYGFWELTSLSSFLLIAFWHRRDRSVYGAQKSFLITVLGGMAMLAGFILLYIMSGTFSIRETIELAAQFSDHALFIPAMLLVLLGALTKSAQFPFHIWLPDAMEAPTPVSAYLHSATMVKAGIFLVARFIPVFGGNAEWFWLVGGAGLATLIWGSFTAIRQTDLKAMLAYSTVSQLGLIMCLLGIGSAAEYDSAPSESVVYMKATAAAVFHLLNHATFKGALFMVVGIVDHETGTRDIRRLGGLMTLMPITFTVAFIGTFSMAGLPPFNGFLSKEMFFTGVLLVRDMDLFHASAWGTLFPLIAWIASIFTFVYSMMIVFKTFGGKKRSTHAKQPHEAPMGMLVSPVILAALAIAFGLFPNIVAYGWIEPAVASIHPGAMYEVHIDYWHGWTTEVYMTIGVIAAGAAIYFGLRYWLRLYRLFPQRLSFSRLYDNSLRWMEIGSRRINAGHMTGSVRSYLAYIFIFMIVLLASTLYVTDSFQFDVSHAAPVALFEWLLAAALVAGASALLFTSSRLAAIIMVGIVGYLVSLFYVVFRAPDLALTQLVIETVSVALFLLCFYHLPQLRKDMGRIRFRAVNAAVALGVGVVVTLFALSVQGVHWFEPISKYFIEASYSEAGGKNIVNVILVDFRGFDTMLEILVIGIAALGVYAMIKLRMTGRDEH